TGMSPGNHTVTVSVKDNYGKADSKSVNFTVTGTASIVNMISPAGGVTVAFPVALSASVTGTATSLQFYISKVGGTYSDTKVATKSGGNWTATWDSTSGGNGNYNIKAKALVGGTSYDSNTITVSY
ncbi:MAG: Ig-like domain-containing protein, partial [Candidatus Dojkabacteria bacterium]|nr:Ig-like domain-containing protein [Candidatus Dojkabacteria bacterium]